jgi:hypothetical protein
MFFDEEVASTVRGRTPAGRRRSARIRTGILCTLAWLALASRAFAQGSSPSPSNAGEPSPDFPPPARFGDAGQLVLSSGLAFDLGKSSHESDDSVFSVRLRPGADFFVANGFSLGGALLFGYRAASSPLVFDTPRSPRSYTVESTAVSYGIQLRAGVDVRMGDRFSFWPNASVGIWTESVTQPQLGLVATRDGVPLPDGDYRETAGYVQLYAPLLFHPARHFFVGAGPEVFVDFLHELGPAENRRVGWGLTTILGGWL